MAERWTDERLDRFADKVDRYIENNNDRMNALSNDIQQLIQALYLELPNIRAEIHSIGEEAKEQRETLHAELVEIKEITRQQAIVAQTQAESLKEITKQQTLAAQTQSDIAKTQAESIRLMIEMLNRKQA